ncbi:MAG: AAA family ATPase [Gemmatimonadota bacterium]|nr:AAA family ATPase [Gemmatimonadota bacterium]
MTPIEQAALDLIRLGLAGDAASVRRYAMRLLKAPDVGAGGGGDLKAGIARLVVDQSAARGVTRSVPREVPVVAAGDTLALAHVEHLRDEVAPILPEDVREVVARITEERRRLDELQRAGLEPTRTVLLTGMPGVGKTMTARYLASSLELPLLSVDLAALMSSYLGKTGQNLRRALDHARHYPSVLLVDEFDALGKRRDDPSDVGELKRIVNVLLSELERWPSHSLFIAATNHPELLDRAIWRRFDQVIEIGLPNAPARREILRRLLTSHGSRVDDQDLSLATDATDGLSGSDLTRFFLEHARRAILRGAGEQELALGRTAMRSLAARAAGNDAEARTSYAGLARDHWRWTQRQIGEELGLSHVTVGKALKVWDAR